MLCAHTHYIPSEDGEFVRQEVWISWAKAAENKRTKAHSYLFNDAQSFHGTGLTESDVDPYTTAQDIVDRLSKPRSVSGWRVAALEIWKEEHGEPESRPGDMPVQDRENLEPDEDAESKAKRPKVWSNDTGSERMETKGKDKDESEEETMTTIPTPKLGSAEAEMIKKAWDNLSSDVDPKDLVASTMPGLIQQDVNSLCPPPLDMLMKARKYAQQALHETPATTSDVIWCYPELKAWAKKNSRCGRSPSPVADFVDELEVLIKSIRRLNKYT